MFNVSQSSLNELENSRISTNASESSQADLTEDSTEDSVSVDPELEHPLDIIEKIRPDDDFAPDQDVQIGAQNYRKKSFGPFNIT